MNRVLDGFSAISLLGGWLMFGWYQSTGEMGLEAISRTAGEPFANFVGVAMLFGVACVFRTWMKG